MIGMDPCTMIAQPSGMDRIEQGAILKAWRKHAGEVRGQRWTQEALAGEIALRAEAKGIPADSRKVPGSHAAVNRWEKGKVDHSLLGLQLIADIYGVGVVDLMQPPPQGAERPAAETASFAAEEDELVTAFRDFVRSRPRR